MGIKSFLIYFIIVCNNGHMSYAINHYLLESNGTRQFNNLMHGIGCIPAERRSKTLVAF